VNGLTFQFRRAAEAGKKNPANTTLPLPFGNAYAIPGFSFLQFQPLQHHCLAQEEKHKKANEQKKANCSCCFLLPVSLLLVHLWL